MTNKLNVGIIGSGAIGAVHADAYLQCGQAELSAMCDIDEAKLVEKGKRFGVKNQYNDYRKLLKNPDIQAVSICVPNSVHKEIAVAALKAGKHILLEKPMAMNAKEAAAIVDTAIKAKRVVQIGMVNRQRPDTQLLREYVQGGELGNIYHIRAVLIRRRGVPGLGGWFTTKKLSGGGPLIDLGVHWFDLAMWISGLWKPTRVSAQNYAKFGYRMADYKYVGMWAGPPKLEGVCDVEDYSTGLVRFGKKATMSFDIAWAANSPDMGFVEFLGDKGGARVMGEGQVELMTEYKGRVATICPQYDPKDSRFTVQAGKFIQAVRGKAAPAATMHEGLTVMKLLDAVYASSAAGKEVVLG